MKITVATLCGDIFVLDISEELEMENFYALCSAELGIPVNEIFLTFNGRPLMDTLSPISLHGIGDGDVVVLHNLLEYEGIESPYDLSYSSQSIKNDPLQPKDEVWLSSIKTVLNAYLPDFIRQDVHITPEDIRQMLLDRPDMVNMLKENNIELAIAFESGDARAFAKEFEKYQKLKEEEARRLNSTPYDVSAQKVIIEEIQKRSAQANRITKVKSSREANVSVDMLFINCKINGHSVTAFIDTGSQSSVISTRCAERCNILSLIDTRSNGFARGIGSQQTIGRIPMVKVEIGNDQLATSFDVVRDQPMDLRLGLNMLRCYQCSIDTKQNVLIIGTTGTREKFLMENDVSRIFAGLKLRTSDDDNARRKDTSCGQSFKDQAMPSTSYTADSDSDEIQLKLNDNFAEATVREVQAFGFSRNEAIWELRKFNGNKYHAITALCAKSLRL